MEKLTAIAFAATLAVLVPVDLPAQTPFIREKSAGGGTMDIGDPIATLGFLFLAGAPQHPCREALDANDDGAIDLSNAVYSLQFLFLGGPPPPAPFPACGPDPSADDLGCGSFPGCPLPPGPPGQVLEQAIVSAG